MKPWTPPASLRSWEAEYDPASSRYANNPAFAQYVAQLLGASPGAFAALEEQLISTARLAGITAQGLEDAKAADWKGEAADQYRQTLGKLPKDLHQVTQSYADALGALGAFAETSLSLKAQYSAFREELVGLKQTWNWVLDTTYPDASAGWAAIHGVQNQLTEVCARGIRILQDSVDAGYELGSRIAPLAAAAPHEGNITKALAPIHWIEDAAKDLWHAISGTPDAIKAFVDDPSWSTLATMTEDLSVDASVIVLAATAPEALAGLGLIDAGADSSILAVGSGVKAVATGVGIGTDGMNVASSVGEEQYAAAALGSVMLATGIRTDLGGDEVDKALDDASLLDSYQAELDAGVTPDAALSKLSKDDAKQLQELVPNYKDPKAVAEATKEADKELAKAGLVGEPKDFVKDHFLTDPTAKAVSQWLDGSTGDGNGNGS